MENYANTKLWVYENIGLIKLSDEEWERLDNFLVDNQAKSLLLKLTANYRVDEAELSAEVNMPDIKYSSWGMSETLAPGTSEVSSSWFKKMIKEKPNEN